MKKATLVLVLVASLTPRTSGAESGIVIKGGSNAATFDRMYRVDRHGFSGGLAGYLQRRLGGRVLLSGQVELLYTPRGSETYIEGILQGKARLHYVDIVIAARPEVRLGPASLYLLLGGGLNLLASANDEDSRGVRRNITNGLHRIDVALLGGAGGALHLPRWGLGPFRLGTVFLEARRDRGLRNVGLTDLRLESRTSALMLGLSFALGPGAKQTAPAACRCP